MTAQAIPLCVLGAFAGCGMYLFSGTSPAPPSIRFRDVAQSSGLRFVLENNPTPQKHMIETMAGASLRLTTTAMG